YGVSFYEYVIVLVLFNSLCYYDGIFLCGKRASGCRMDNLSSSFVRANVYCRIWIRDDLMVNQYGIIYYLSGIRGRQLYQYNFEHVYQRYGPLENAIDNLVIFLDCNCWFVVLPGVGFGCCSIVF